MRMYLTRGVGLVGLLLLVGLFKQINMVQAQSVAYQKPIVVKTFSLVVGGQSNCANYEHLAPLIAEGFITADTQFGRINDFDVLRRDPLCRQIISDYRIAFGSTSLMEQLFAEPPPPAFQGQFATMGDYLIQSVGLTTVAINIEGGLTPVAEFDARFNLDGSNSIVKFVESANSFGLRSVWAPLRDDLDRGINLEIRQPWTDAEYDGLLQLMYQTGLDGIALQEQVRITGEAGPGCVEDRLTAVRDTFDRHQRLAGSQLEEFIVQIVAARCETGDTYAVNSCGLNLQYQYQHCDQFIDTLDSQGLARSLASFPTADEIGMLTVVRTGGLVTPTPLPSGIVTATPTAIPNLPSDINQDGRINGEDARLVLAGYGSTQLCGGFDCDVLADGEVNGLDAVEVVIAFEE